MGSPLIFNVQLAVLIPFLFAVIKCLARRKCRTGLFCLRKQKQTENGAGAQNLRACSQQHSFRENSTSSGFYNFPEQYTSQRPSERMQELIGALHIQTVMWTNPLLSSKKTDRRATYLLDLCFVLAVISINKGMVCLWFWEVSLAHGQKGWRLAALVSSLCSCFFSLQLVGPGFL